MHLQVIVTAQTLQSMLQSKLQSSLQSTLHPTLQSTVYKAHQVLYVTCNLQCALPADEALPNTFVS